MLLRNHHERPNDQAMNRPLLRAAGPARMMLTQDRNQWPHRIKPSVTVGQSRVVENSEPSLGEPR